jgi:hypothetical protein
MITWLSSAHDLWLFLEHLALNMAFIIVVIGAIYGRLYARRDFVFTYFLLNAVVFALSYLMSAVNVPTGLGLGLFAVFGILRYRTEAIGVRDLTYLLVAIGIGLVNGLAGGAVIFPALVVINTIVAVMVGVLEALPISRREYSRTVLYDRLDLLEPEQSAGLLDDLRRRTHLPVEHYEIGNVDLLRDSVEVCVFYSRSRSVRTYPRTIAGKRVSS